MSSDQHDIAIARFVRQTGLATAEQVASAMQTQSRSVQSGSPVSLAQVLVQQGILTPAQRETVEKKAQAQRAGITELLHYKLVRKLGEGGMGAVYLADDTKQNRKVAVKVLPKKYADNAELVKRFRREADAAGKLKHPNIVCAYAFGEDIGYHFYVMEYCDGEPLDAVLKRDKTLPIPKALDVTQQVARGLKFAHDMGFIHRDIKPANIFLTKDGAAKILDLGLSKNIEDAEVSFKTASGAVLGTPHYISPEQAQGEKNVDGRTDIYSLGATFYHFLTGQTPFDGTTVFEILSKQVSAQLPNPQDLREEVPEGVVHVLRRMMAKTPADRYRDCGDLIDDLEQIITGKTPATQVLDPNLSAVALIRKKAPAKRPGTLRRAPVPKRARSPVLWLGIAAVSVVALVLAAMNARGPVAVPLPAKPPEARSSAPVRALPPPVDEDFVKVVSALPPEQQLRRVMERLKEVNPGFDGKARNHKIEDGRLTELEVSGVAVRDLRPIRALTFLRLLKCVGHGQKGDLEDLSPLKGMGLTILDVTANQLRDLRPLQGLRLERLYCSSNSINDLSPLTDMPLTTLICEDNPLTDIRPLSGMKLDVVSLSGSGRMDLTPLRNTSLQTLYLKKIPGLDLAPLKGSRIKQIWLDLEPAQAVALRSLTELQAINGRPAAEVLKAMPGPDPWTASVALLPAEEQLRRVMDRLKELNPKYDKRDIPRFQDGKLVYLRLNTLHLRNIAPIAALQDLRTLHLSGGWSEEEKRVVHGVLTDLSPLRGMKLKELMLNHNPLKDLTPLEGMPLTLLQIDGTEVENLAPIAGMPLIHLDLRYTKVSDLTPLRGMTLHRFYSGNSRVTDHSVLRGMPLKIVGIDFDATRDIDVVRSWTTLEEINELKAADFLKSFAPAAAPRPPDSAVNLLVLIEPERDRVAGQWKIAGGELVCDASVGARIEIPYRPPEEYDFTIVFTPSGPSNDVHQVLSKGDRSFAWWMGGFSNTLFMFDTGTHSHRTHPSRVEKPRCLEPGRKHISNVQVRKDGVAAYLDGQFVTQFKTDYSNFTVYRDDRLRDNSLLGLHAHNTKTVFHRVELVEVTGRGRRTR